ncbi:kinase-like protein [Cucurbitaria berberidis CBS 394.84]|uniref:Kinase-like protein n=1 Tax=Cucurbitaria berberidis CBS 394.84 TaxID=1168544 RepID=A0A9P4G9U7_9PLEO|nr:kinase-like protein [Cucurbitaria berberidis CBS 394.84]KAF1841665.1 kinase-like protein [Cucurbitaria berberidis CBS 394.84]
MDNQTNQEAKEQNVNEVHSDVSSDDRTLVNEANSHKAIQFALKDWSQTSRGSHVDFKDEETLPLEQGRFLGRGAVGDVHETTIQGWKLAHKRIHVRLKIGDKEKREIKILKRLSHVHMIQLIGTYTQQKVLGLLLFPVATCDLHTFFEDVEAWTTTNFEGATPETRYSNLESSHKERLNALGYDFPTENLHLSASPIYFKVGCLISAVAYLHEQKIRHKDLKPSNILLSRDRLWLSDFGSATDFTLLSQSATDNERGTARYFSPEMAKWEPSGRASDIFSLGCVLLEILVLHQTGSLEHIRRNRSLDSSFHANIGRINAWLDWPNMKFCPRDHLLRWEVRVMLSRDPVERPTAKELLTSVTGCDIGRRDQSSLSIFGECCKGAYLSRQQHEEQTSGLREGVRFLQRMLDATREKEKSWQVESEVLNQQLRDVELKARDEAKQNEQLEQAVGRLKDEKRAWQAHAVKLSQAQSQLTEQLKDPQSTRSNLEKELQSSRHYNEGRIKKSQIQLQDKTVSTVSEKPDSEGSGLPSKGERSLPQNTASSAGGAARQRKMKYTYDYSTSEDDEDDELQRTSTLSTTNDNPPDVLS